MLARCLSGTSFLQMHVFLETERLVLRRFTEDDVDELVALDGDPEVMRYVTGGRPTSREEIETEVLPALPRLLRAVRRVRLLGGQSRSRAGMSSGGSTSGPRTRIVPTTVELGYRLRMVGVGEGVRNGGVAGA